MATLPAKSPAKNWERNMVAKIRRKLNRRETCHLQHSDFQRHHLAQLHPWDAVNHLAEAARCDWLYSPLTGARFFEFM